MAYVTKTYNDAYYESFHCERGRSKRLSISEGMENNCDYDCKRGHRNDHRDELVDIASDVDRPNRFIPGTTIPRTLTAGTETIVATLTIDYHKKVSKVLLEGVLHLAGSNADTQAIVRIRKAGGFSQSNMGEIIYETPPLFIRNVLAVVSPGAASAYNAIPIQHVDFGNGNSPVTYSLTVSVPVGAPAPVLQAPPTTFTAVAIKRVYHAHF